MATRYPMPDEIINSVNTPGLILASEARQGYFSRNKHGRLLTYSGGFGIIFQFSIGGKTYAFRCWHKDPGDSVNAQKYQAMSRYLSTHPCLYFLPFTYQSEGIVVDGAKYPTLTMEWGHGSLLKEFLADHLLQRSKLMTLAAELEEMFVCLHRLQVAHGDLQHGNILVHSTGKPLLLDYDSVFVPALRGEKATIVGYENYQHPARKHQLTLNEKMDYFSEVIILLSVLGIALNPDLWTRYKVAETEGLLFEKSDFTNLVHARIYADLRALRNRKVDFLLDVLITYLNINDISLLTSVWEMAEYLALSKPAIEGTVNLADYISLQSELKAAYQTVYRLEKQLKKLREEHQQTLEALKRSRDVGSSGYPD